MSETRFYFVGFGRMDGYQICWYARCSHEHPDRWGATTCANWHAQRRGERVLLKVMDSLTLPVLAGLPVVTDREAA